LGEGWVPVVTATPKPGRWVLAHYVNVAGSSRSVRATYADTYTLPLPDDQEEWDGCTEGDDGTWYAAPGWYETNDNEETSWRISEEVTHWMPLPDPPAEFARQA
jgi:hypothetical protein